MALVIERIGMHTSHVKTTIKATAVCAIGLEKVLARDLAHLGFRDVARSAGRVFFEIGVEKLAQDLSIANMGLRTADRVLLVVGEFKAVNFDEFYQGVLSIQWDRYCMKDTKVLVERARTNHCALHAQATLQSMTQKAIYGALMERFRVQKMPETGATLEVRVYGENDRWQVVVDTSGEALSKRGYRKFAHAAPLKETIAASMLFLAGWSRARPLIDPFCGSGTIPIEAALYASNIAPGIKRSFSYELFPEMDKNKIEDMRVFFKQQARRDIRTDILGSDIDEKAIHLALSNAKLAGISEFVRFKAMDAREAVPGGARGVLLANPPYGQRLSNPEEAHELYRQLGPIIGKFLDADWECGILSAHEDFADTVGIQPTSVREIVSGQEKIYFNWFSGTSRTKNRSSSENLSLQ